MRAFSGIKPSGDLHLGNYFGAIAQGVELQKSYEALYCVVDLHAITVHQEPDELRARTHFLAAAYLAAGIDPKKNILFVQSHVPAHAELAWIFNCTVRMSELSRMTQYKDKLKQHKPSYEQLQAARLKIMGEIKKLGLMETPPFSVKSEEEKREFLAEHMGRCISELEDIYRLENVSVGIFDYPVLMAADILLYDTDVVPVGHDQIQHVELACDIANRFNKQYGETFKVPKTQIQKVGARVMSLDDPSQKMSKEQKNTVLLMDDAETIRKKIGRALTDSVGTIGYDKSRPGISNLVEIYHHATGKSVVDIVAAYEGKGYKEFKSDLAEHLIALLAPLQTKIKAYLDAPKELDRILKDGADRANEIAEKKLFEVKKKIGLI